MARVDSNQETSFSLSKENEKFRDEILSFRPDELLSNLKSKI